MGSDYYEIFNIDCFVIEGILFDNVYVVVVNLVFSCVCMMIGMYMLCYGVYIVSFFDCGDCIKCKYIVIFNVEDVCVDFVIMVEVL